MVLEYSLESINLVFFHCSSLYQLTFCFCESLFFSAGKLILYISSISSFTSYVFFQEFLELMNLGKRKSCS
jgi:hypothetical protein